MNKLPSRFQEMVLSLFDDELSSEEMAQVDLLLRTNAEARRVYRELATLHSALEEQGASEATLRKTSPIPVAELLNSQYRRNLRNSLLISAAVLTLVGIFLALKMIPESATAIAAYRTGPNTELSFSHKEKGVEGNSLAEGSCLHLSRGTVEILFQSGATCLIEAPGVLEVKGEGQVVLSKGVAWFNVPEHARGFTVVAKNFEAVDLGTKFGIVAKDSLSQELHVVQGLVELHTFPTSEAESLQVLEAGEGRRVNAAGEIELISARENAFVTKLPSRKPSQIKGVQIAEVSSQLNPQRKAENLINGAGFDEGQGFHSNENGDDINWVNAGLGLNDLNQDPLPASLTFDLSGRYQLASIKIWNWNTLATLSAGVKDLRILVREDESSSFKVLDEFRLNEAPGSFSQDFGQVIQLHRFVAADKVKQVRLEILSNHGHEFELAGLSEIRFFGSALNEQE